MASRARAGSHGHELRLCRVFATHAFGSLSLRSSSRFSRSASDTTVQCPSKCPGDSKKSCRHVDMELQLFAWKKQSKKTEGSGKKKLAPLGSNDVEFFVASTQTPSAPDFDMDVGYAPSFRMAGGDASAPELTPRTSWECHCYCIPSAPELDPDDVNTTLKSIRR